MRTVIFPLLLAMAFLSAMAAHAHTGLIKSVPASGAQEQLSPPAIELLFGADVRLIDLRLTKDDGQAVKLEKSRDLTPARRFRVALPPLSADSYRVDWVVMGGDSHKMTGSFGFSVGANASP